MSLLISVLQKLIWREVSCMCSPAFIPSLRTRRACTSQIPPLEGSLEAHCKNEPLTSEAPVLPLHSSCSSAFLFSPLLWVPFIYLLLSVLPFLLAHSLTFLSLTASLLPLFFLFYVPLFLFFHFSLPSIFIPCFSSLLPLPSSHLLILPYLPCCVFIFFLPLPFLFPAS